MTPRFGDRRLFPTLDWAVYLNHAAVSPLSTPVRQAAREALDDLAARGMGSIGDALTLRAELRSRVARFVGAAVDDIGFPPGTTRGIIDIALAIDWRPGDRIVVFEGEFPSNVTPWIAAAERFGAEVVFLPLTGFGDGSGDGLQRVEDVLRQGRVRIVAASAVQFSTGLRMPLDALGQLAHAHDAELFVDAVQALGVCPVPLAHVDYLVSGAHKWLMSVDGIAIAYASPQARARMRPLTAGWLSVVDPVDFLLQGAGKLSYTKPLRTSLDWMEGGVQTQAAFAALHASVGLLASLGPDALLAHTQALHDQLEPPLREQGFISARASDPTARSGILSLQVPAGVDLPALHAALAERSISVSTPDGWLRLSPHWPNHASEVPVVIGAMAEAVDAARC